MPSYSYIKVDLLDMAMLTCFLTRPWSSDPCNIPQYVTYHTHILFNYSKGCLWFMINWKHNLDIYSCQPPRLPIFAKREYVFYCCTSLGTDHRQPWQMDPMLSYRCTPLGETVGETFLRRFLITNTQTADLTEIWQYIKMTLRDSISSCFSPLQIANTSGSQMLYGT